MILCGRMSRGQCQPKTRGQCQPKNQPARATFGRCNSKSKNVIIIDVDRRKIDVIIVDAPESSNLRSRHPGASLKPKNMCSPSNVISIDDEGDDDDDGFIYADKNATSTKPHYPSNKCFSEESDSDECEVLAGEGVIFPESPNWMFDNHSSESSTSESDMSDCDVSERDYETTDSSSDSDYEIMDDSSINFREEWEKAALKRKMERCHSLLKEECGVFGSHNETGIPMHETTQEKDDFMSIGGDACAVLNGKKFHVSSYISTNGKQDLPHVPDTNDCQVGEGQGSFPCDTSMQHGLDGNNENVCSAHNEGVNRHTSSFTAGIADKHQDEDVFGHESSPPCNIHCFSRHVPESRSRKVTDVAEDTYSLHPQANSASSEPGISRIEIQAQMDVDRSLQEDETISQGPSANLVRDDMNPGKIEQSTLENANLMPDTFGKWEKVMEAVEYKLAKEEEWASRRQQLQIQAEEIQKLRKRKRAENLRLLEIEKRQKQRLEEMREFQKQEEEAINLKDQLRAEIRKELENLETKYRDMASLLRGLGINVSGGLYPMSHEVNAAYRQALRTFHPDRALRTDIRQQIEAEEKFKLISRLREKLHPIAY